jgi:putative ABC transport system permease protein
MFRNFFTTTLRNLARHKGYSLITILGLAIGLTVFSLLALYVTNELGADQYHANANRLYRVDMNEKFGITSIPLMQYTLDTVEEVEAASRLMPYSGAVKYQENRQQTRLTCVDPDFFRMFDFTALRGDLHDALAEPGGIILLQSFAHRLFGDADPIGKVVQFNDIDFTVRAIAADPVRRSQLFVQSGFIAFENLRAFGEDFDNWMWGNYVTYLMFPEGTDQQRLIDQVEAQYQTLKQEHGDHYPDYFLRPFTPLYFDGTKYDHSNHGNRSTVTIFSAAALLIILIAAINFINLATARAMVRAREIGVRKVVGAQQRNLVHQFLGESIITTLLAGIITIAFLELLYPRFADFFEMNLPLHSWLHAAYFLAGLVVLGLIAGIYPAIYLASSIPVEVLKGAQVRGIKGATFRKVLTVFQFAISIALIAGTLIASSQLHYMRTTDAGYTRDHIVHIRLPRGLEDNKQTLKEQILQVTGVQQASYIYTSPGRVILTWGFTDQDGNDYQYRALPTDPEFIDLYEIELVQGRNFSWETQTDQQHVIVNETFLKEFNVEDPFTFPMWDGHTPIIGVVKDFNFRTLHFDYEPLVLLWSWDNVYSVAIKLDAGNPQPTLDALKSIWQQYDPETDFSYMFFDEQFNAMYRNDIRFGSIFRYCTVLAIIIACLGLFGLAAFVTSQRTREIGIRKVLGAPASSIARMLSVEFIRWVALANCIAWPVSWLVMQKWLSRFAFHTSINPLLLVAAGLIAIGIALVTVLYHSLKAAHANPVQALKYE